MNEQRCGTQSNKYYMCAWVGWWIMSRHKSDHFLQLSHYYNKVLDQCSQVIIINHLLQGACCSLTKNEAEIFHSTAIMWSPSLFHHQKQPFLPMPQLSIWIDWSMERVLGRNELPLRVDPSQNILSSCGGIMCCTISNLPQKLWST